MAKEMTFTVIDNSDLVKQATSRQIKQALIAIGAMVETHAKANYVPVDTGRLKNSITFALAGDVANIRYYRPDRYLPDDNQSRPYLGVAPPDQQTDVRSVYVGSNVEYAEIVEFGTSGRTARHYLRDAVNNHMEEYKSLAVRALSGTG